MINKIVIILFTVRDMVQNSLIKFIIATNSSTNKFERFPLVPASAHRSFSVGGLFILWASADAVRHLVRNPQ